MQFFKEIMTINIGVPKTKFKLNLKYEAGSITTKKGVMPLLQ